jgi:hypothetical protein
MNNLKRGKVYLGSWFQSMITWPSCFGPTTKQYTWQRKASHLLLTREKREQEERNRLPVSTSMAHLHDLLPPKVFTTAPWHQLQANPSTHELWGTFMIEAIKSFYLYPKFQVEIHIPKLYVDSD